MTARIEDYRAISDAFAANPAGEHSLTCLINAAVKLHDRALEEAVRPELVPHHRGWRFAVLLGLVVAVAFMLPFVIDVTLLSSIAWGLW